MQMSLREPYLSIGERYKTDCIQESLKGCLDYAHIAPGGLGVSLLSMLCPPAPTRIPQTGKWAIEAACKVFSQPPPTFDLVGNSELETNFKVYKLLTAYLNMKVSFYIKKGLAISFSVEPKESTFFMEQNSCFLARLSGYMYFALKAHINHVYIIRLACLSFSWCLCGRISQSALLHVTGVLYFAV